MVPRAVQRLLILSVLVGLAWSGVSCSDTTVRELEVAAYKVGCHGFAGPPLAWLCLHVREVGETRFRPLFETPIGFDFEWGFNYVIRVIEEERSPVPVDGSSIVRRLDRVISMAPVPDGTTFDLMVSTSRLERVTEDRFDLTHEPVELQCVPALDCTELASAVEASGSQAQPGVIAATLQFPNDSGEPLDILAWHLCSEASGSCSEP